MHLSLANMISTQILFRSSSHCRTRLPSACALYSSVAGSTYVKRLTMFKIPREEDIDIVLNEYEILRKNAMKDGRPYIVSNVARRILNTSSSLSEGFTLASQSIFKNKADHDFYDQICPAHKELKKTTSKVRTGVMTIVTEGEWPEPQM